MDLLKLVRQVPDFPKKGILFYDLGPLMSDSIGFHTLTRRMKDLAYGFKASKIVCIESRGFVIGAALATLLGTGLVLARKKGKLPPPKSSVDYQLEYGSDMLEMNLDLINVEDRVLIVDDVLATGGTIRAVESLLPSSRCNVVGSVSILQIGSLEGHSKLYSKHAPLFVV